MPAACRPCGRAHAGAGSGSPRCFAQLLRCRRAERMPSPTPSSWPRSHRRLTAPTCCRRSHRRCCSHPKAGQRGPLLAAAGRRAARDDGGGDNRHSRQARAAGGRGCVAGLALHRRLRGAVLAAPGAGCARHLHQPRCDGRQEGGEPSPLGAGMWMGRLAWPCRPGCGLHAAKPLSFRHQPPSQARQLIATPCLPPNFSSPGGFGGAAAGAEAAAGAAAAAPAGGAVPGRDVRAGRLAGGGWGGGGREMGG